MEGESTDGSDPVADVLDRASKNVVEANGPQMELNYWPGFDRLEFSFESNNL